MKITSQQGFSLIELLVVIAIVGILASVVMLSVSSARIKARDAKRAGDMRQMISALEQFYIHNGIYPTGSASIASIGTGVLLSDPGAFDGSGEPMVPRYIGLMPQAPMPADESCGSDTGRGQNNYWYDVEDDGSTYTITFCLGRDVDTWVSGIRSATPNGVY